MQTTDNTEKRCPDNGMCHHSCQKECYRARCCVPLSDYGDVWPADIRPVVVDVVA